MCSQNASIGAHKQFLRSLFPEVCPPLWFPWSFPVPWTPLLSVLWPGTWGFSYLFCQCTSWGCTHIWDQMSRGLREKKERGSIPHHRTTAPPIGASLAVLRALCLQVLQLPCQSIPLLLPHLGVPWTPERMEKGKTSDFPDSLSTRSLLSP